VVSPAAPRKLSGLPDDVALGSSSGPPEKTLGSDAVDVAPLVVVVPASLVDDVVAAVPVELVAASLVVVLVSFATVPVEWAGAVAVSDACALVCVIVSVALEVDPVALEVDPVAASLAGAVLPDEPDEPLPGVVSPVDEVPAPAAESAVCVAVPVADEVLSCAAAVVPEAVDVVPCAASVAEELVACTVEPAEELVSWAGAVLCVVASLAVEVVPLDVESLVGAGAESVVACEEEELDVLDVDAAASVATPAVEPAVVDALPTAPPVGLDPPVVGVSASGVSSTPAAAQNRTKSSAVPRSRRRTAALLPIVPTSGCEPLSCMRQYPRRMAFAPVARGVFVPQHGQHFLTTRSRR
jgi:hypothetical protein